MKHVVLLRGLYKDRKGVVVRESTDFGMLVHLYNNMEGHEDEFELSVWVSPLVVKVLA